MKEQFILRVPPSVAERLDRLLSESAPDSEEQPLDLSFRVLANVHGHVPMLMRGGAELLTCIDFGDFGSMRLDGRSGSFIIGNEHFPTSLLDLPCVVESYKTYDDCALVKTADIGQMIMVREAEDSAPDLLEYRHGLTPPMRDARKRRFRREPDLNPELVQRVERDLLNIMAGGTVENIDVEVNEQEEDGVQNARNASKKTLPTPAAKPNTQVAVANAEEPERSDSDESGDSI